MKSEFYIQGYCHIKNNKVSLNGNVLFTDASESFPDFIKAAYKHLNTQYSKFFKMDNLSKLAFLSADILLKENGSGATTSDRVSPEAPPAGRASLAVAQVKEENIAIVLSNRSSSLDTDRKYQQSISDPEEYYPSPAVFVYTLPNICIGEISIKHKLFSENSFFIFDHFNAAHLFDYATQLLQTKKAEKVLCGWVDYEEDKYEAFLYLVASEGDTEHTKEEITRLYRL